MKIHIIKAFATVFLCCLLIFDEPVNGSPVYIFGLGDFGLAGMN